MEKKNLWFSLSASPREQPVQICAREKGALGSGFWREKQRTCDWENGKCAIWQKEGSFMSFQIKVCVQKFWSKYDFSQGGVMWGKI